MDYLEIIELRSGSSQCMVRRETGGKIMKITFKLTLLKSSKVLFSRLFSGRIHFLKEYAGKILVMEDGKTF
jgi:hypothetical protein